MLVVFWPIFVADTKIISHHGFLALLTIWHVMLNVHINDLKLFQLHKPAWHERGSCPP